MSVYPINSVLVRACVSKDQAEVIRIGQSHNGVVTQLVTFARISLKFLNDRVKHKDIFRMKIEEKKVP